MSDFCPITTTKFFRATRHDYHYGLRIFLFHFVDRRLSMWPRRKTADSCSFCFGTDSTSLIEEPLFFWTPAVFSLSCLESKSTGDSIKTIDASQSMGGVSPNSRLAAFDGSSRRPVEIQEWVLKPCMLDLNVQYAGRYRFSFSIRCPTPCRLRSIRRRSSCRPHSCYSLQARLLRMSN